MVNTQLRAKYREVYRPAKEKGASTGPESVLCSRCQHEIGQPRPTENKRKAAEPGQPAAKKFDGQCERRPASRAVFDRLGVQSPSTSAGYKDRTASRPIKTFKPPVVRDDRWYHTRPGGNAEPLTKTQLRRMQRQVQQARVQTAQAEGSKRRKKTATTNEPPSMPVAPPTATIADTRPLRTWRPKQEGDSRGTTAASVEPKAVASERTDKGIVDVYRGRDPPFSANGLSFLMEFHKDHSATDLYGMTPENREIVELALKNTKAEALLITSGSESAIKAVYQANREAKAKGMPGHQPDQGRLEDKAPFSRSDLDYLRQYFTVTPADTVFGLTTEESARVGRLEDYLAARDAIAEVRRALEKEAEATNPSKGRAFADDSLETARPMTEGPGDPFFGHEAEDDPALGISDEEYEGILGMIEEAGGQNQQGPEEFGMNMVLMLPSEFSAPGGQTDGLENDVAEEQLDQRPRTKEELLAMAFN